MECCVCYEEFTEEPLPCGHQVHRDCVQKSADALQDIRATDGYPPIHECPCPVCRQPVEGMVPKDPPENLEDIEIVLQHDDLMTAVDRWNDNPDKPLDQHILDILCEKYPNEQPMILYASASMYTLFIHSGMINLQSLRDNRFSQILNRVWKIF